MKKAILTESQKAIKNKYDEVATVVKNAKSALIGNRTENGFTDKNYMREPGILCESSALIGLLLLVEAFYDNAVDEDGVVNPVIEEVENRIDFASDIETIKEIQKDSLLKIYNWYETEGFTAKPLIKRGYEKVFMPNDNQASYIDTVTYVLSATILSNWLNLSKKLVLDSETKAINTKLLAISLKILLDAQHEDGRWGFRADTLSESSLYFTYSAGASLADFFDYILGEIVYTIHPEWDEEKQERKATELKDDDVVNEINKILGISDIESRVNDARTKLQDWLLDVCLPRMPKIAQCEAFSLDTSKAYHEIIGIWMPDKETKYSKYFKLNYIYYLLDLMVIQSTDKRFAKILENPDSKRWQDFKAAYKEVLEEQDFKYLFESKNVSSIWETLMAQTIHTSRAQYMVASRTGVRFWKDAELRINLNHETLSDECWEIESDTTCVLRDPSIVPMALRANTNFCYYISKQSDMEVDRLFVEICKEIANDEDPIDTVTSLWDKKNYNVQLTERSIEAVVDYYDYLNKIDGKILAEAISSSDAEDNKEVVAQTKSPFELAMEAKIAEYLSSAEGQKLIEEKVAARIAEINITPAAEVSGSAGSLDVQSVIDFVSLINKKNRTKYNPDGDDVDTLMSVLEILFEKVQQCSIHRTVLGGINGGANTDENDDAAIRATQSIFDQYKELLVAMANNENLNDEDNKLAFLYNSIKDKD